MAAIERCKFCGHWVQVLVSQHDEQGRLVATLRLCERHGEMVLEQIPNARISRIAAA